MKYSSIKFTVDELDALQDELLSLINVNDKESVEREENWYNGYDVKTNLMIRGKRIYIE